MAKMGKATTTPNLGKQPIWQGAKSTSADQTKVKRRSADNVHKTAKKSVKY